MNYLHFDSTNLFFLVKSLPMHTQFTLMFGLSLTGGICIAERIVTSRLESVSMKLIFGQQQQEDTVYKSLPRSRIENRVNTNTTTTTATTSTSTTTSTENRSLNEQGDSQTSIPALSSARGQSIHPSNMAHSFRSEKTRSEDMKGLMAQKMFFYGLANILRLCYMLLAMSFHIGVLAVIVCSLTCTQLYIDLTHSMDNNIRVKSGPSEYQLLGGEELRASEEDSVLYNLDGNQVDRQLQGATPLRNNRNNQNNAALMARSLDCV